MKKIRWNEVTWYSKLLAAVVFVAVFLFGFYLGIRYEDVLLQIQLLELRQLQNPIIHLPSGPVGQRQNAGKELVFSYPYPVTWTGWNGARVSLAGISLGNQAVSTSSPQKKEIYALVLRARVDASGGFCTNSFISSVRRLLNEEGSLSAPLIPENNCADPNSTLLDQRILFPVSETDKNITIQVLNTNGTAQTFFVVHVLDDGTLKLETAPIEG
jgi:hypothetical protein